MLHRVENLGLSSVPPYIGEFTAYRWWQYHVALPLLAPKLDCLDLQGDMGLDPDDYRILADAGLNRYSLVAQHFQHLHSIRLGPVTIDVALFHSILRIESLRTLIIEDAYDDYFVKTDISAVGVSLLENLYLMNSCIDSKVVASLLMFIKNLCVFVHEFETTWRRTLHYPTLESAILVHKNSLEHLSIESTMFHRGQGTFGNLDGLQKLRVLDIGIEDVTDVPSHYATNSTLKKAANDFPLHISAQVPKSLRKLHLTVKARRDGQYWWYNLKEIANRCKEKAPDLMEVKIFIDDGWQNPSSPPRTNIHQHRVVDIRNVVVTNGMRLVFKDLHVSRYQRDKGHEYLPKHLPHREVGYLSNGCLYNGLFDDMMSRHWNPPELCFFRP